MLTASCAAWVQNKTGNNYLSARERMSKEAKLTAGIRFKRLNVVLNRTVVVDSD